MKVFTVTFGSLGDVAPYVALGVGLRARGHEVDGVAKAVALIEGYDGG